MAEKTPNNHNLVKKSDFTMSVTEIKIKCVISTSTAQISTHLIKVIIRFILTTKLMQRKKLTEIRLSTLAEPFLAVMRDIEIS